MPEARRTILLVEDEMLIASDEQKQLEDEGYSVFVVLSGAKAIAFVKERARELDLILMDINLGRGMDGTEAARAILKEFDIPVLFLSSYTDKGTLDKTQNVSSYGFVVKTAGIAVLSASIRMAINLHEALLELRTPESGPGWEEKVDEFFPPVADDGWIPPAVLLAAMESTADAILIVTRDGSIAGFNKMFSDLWNIPDGILARKDNEEALAFVCGQLRDPEAFVDKVREIHGQPDHESFDELTFKDGRIYERFSRPLYLKGKTAGRVSSFRDVTEQRRAVEALRESEERHRLISSLTTDYFFRLSVDAEGRPVLDNVSKNFPQVTGRTMGAAATPDMWKAFIHPDDLGLLMNALNRLLAEGGSADLEARSTVQDGRQRWVSVVARALRSPAGDRTTAIVGAVKDITERKTVEEELRKTAAQKDVLMKEMRHRIKNSLAVVSGLLTLETENMTDPRSREILLNTRRRILSISSIYDLLNKSIAVNDVDMRALVNSLAEALVKTHTGAAGRFLLKTSLDDVRLDAQRAFPLAFILNELVTNALKHAYAADGGGEIRVDLKKAGGTIALRIEDDGSGLPENVDPATAESTGLSLIRILSEQVDAAVTFAKAPGTKVTVEVPESAG